MEDTITLKYDRFGRMDRRAVLGAFADGLYISQVFGPDRPLVARSIVAYLMGIIPTDYDTSAAAYGYGSDRKVRAYRNGRKYVFSVYPGYFDPDTFPYR